MEIFKVNIKGLCYASSAEKIIFCVLIALFLFNFTADRALSSEKELLTVEKALILAEENNPVISATKKKVAQSEERLKQAEASSYPSIVAKMGYQETGEEPRLPVFTEGRRRPIGYAQDGFKETWQAALEMTWLLYSGGAVKNNVQAKELALGSVEAEATRTYQSVRNGVYSAWHELQRTRARLKVAEEALKLAETHLHEVNLLYENGLVAKNQVLRVQVEVSNSKLNLVKAVNAVDVAWSALERAVGTDLQMDYTLPETRNSVDEFTIPSELRQLAMENRPELLALEKSRKSALAMARSAAGASRPQVALKAETFEVDDEFFPDKEDDWRVSISANWELFDGGASRARVEEAKAAAEEVLYRIEDLKKQINLEVSTAVLNLRSATQRVNLAKDQVKSAEEDYRIALKRYSAQVGTNIDVLDSRVALVNAKTQLANAVYDVYQARADLQYALGLDLYGGKNEGNTL